MVQKIKKGDIVAVAGGEKLGIVTEICGETTAAVKLCFDGETVCDEKTEFDTEMLAVAHLEESDLRKGYLEYIAKPYKAENMWLAGPRSEKRIPYILSRIEKLWRKYPDMRLGQLLSAINSGKDLFYTEDSALMEKLQQFEDGQKKS